MRTRPSTWMARSSPRRSISCGKATLRQTAAPTMNAGDWILKASGRSEYSDSPARDGNTRSWRVLVAQQAIDHDELYPGSGLPDLSRAVFEVVGTGQDIDNPAVPNMEHVGFRPSVDPLGRGLLLSLIPILVVVDNVDLESLPTDKLPLKYPDYHRFPGEAILDLVTTQPIPRAHLTWRFCERLVSGVFDRQVASSRTGGDVSRLARDGAVSPPISTGDTVLEPAGTPPGPAAMRRAPPPGTPPTRPPAGGGRCPRGDRRRLRAMPTGRRRARQPR